MGHGEAYTRVEGSVNQVWTAGSDGIPEDVEMRPLQIVGMATKPLHNHALNLSAWVGKCGTKTQVSLPVTLRPTSQSKVAN